MLNLDKDKKYLLACSFGPDSMALFQMLLDENFDFEVAHVNYHLREESDEETANLTAFCRLFSKKLHIFNVENFETKANLEEQCREIRYTFFNSLFNRFDALLVAHNQDDLIETFLLQEKRKSIVSYYGLKSTSKLKEMTIIRPLLTYKKSELLAFCNEHSVPYSIDKTNLEDNFERNKIRHQVVEKLSDVERQKYIENINFKNEELKSINDKISTLNIQNIRDLTVISDLELSLYVHKLARFIDPSTEISMRQIKEVRKALSSSKANVIINVGPLEILKEYDSIKFNKKTRTQTFEYTLEKPGKIDCEFFFLDFTVSGENRNVFESDYPIKIRNANPNDFAKIKNYRKSYRRLCIDWKIPVSIRPLWPVIENKNGDVIYIPRYRATFAKTDSSNFYVKLK